MTRNKQYGVFKWRGDNCYAIMDAESLYVHERVAQKRADTLNGPSGNIWVVRTLAYCRSTEACCCEPCMC